MVDRGNQQDDRYLHLQEQKILLKVCKNDDFFSEVDGGKHKLNGI